MKSHKYVQMWDSLWEVYVVKIERENISVLRLMASDYRFGIFKLFFFLHHKANPWYLISTWLAGLQCTRLRTLEREESPRYNDKLQGQFEHTNGEGGCQYFDGQTV